MSSKGKVVCVTGGSGYIGSWLVRLLLNRGYTVHATVKDLQDERETKHLLALEGADSSLRLFQIDLLDYDSIAAAITGTVGVFHLASPNIIDRVQDPARELVEPAVIGTKNVLAAAKQFGIQRVVVTSSTSAITPSPSWPADVVKGEDCWTDVEYCKQKGQLWYSLSKTLAEKAAWEFAKERDLDVVVINPGFVFGPILPPTLNASMSVPFRLLQGSTETYPDLFMGCVHVKDVALAHILVYESTCATGRHLCVEAVSHYGDFAAIVAELHPEYNVPRLPKETQPGLLRAKNASKKLMDLGLEFIPMEQIIEDSIESLKRHGLHGPPECLLNTIEACAIDVWPDLFEHFPFIYCIETLAYDHNYPQWESCFEKLGLDPKPIGDCYTSRRGKELELEYAAETNALRPPHEYVPWVVVDGQPLLEDYENFISYVCKAYKGSAVPSACNDLSRNSIILKENPENVHPVSYADENHAKETLLSKIQSSIRSWAHQMIDAGAAI